VEATMLLCDTAQVVNGKLYIMGGGWSLTGPAQTPSAVAVKLDVAASETDMVHEWSIDLEDSDGHSVPIETPQGIAPIQVHGTLHAQRPEGTTNEATLDIPLAVNIAPLPLLPGNRYVWRLSIDGQTRVDWTLPFTVRAEPTTL
jgi:hypothetical protein